MSNSSLYNYSAVGNATIPSNNNTSLYNPGGGNAIPINGNINANNVNVSNNVTVGGQVSVTGNITTAGYFIGDGGLLSNIASSYGNANVTAFLPTYTGNLAGNNLALQGAAAVTGNITTSGYFFGNGSQLTGIAASYGNANVAAFLPTYTGNLAGGNLAVTGDITGSNIVITGGLTAQGDVSTYANLRTLGAQGNIVGADYVSANYFVGDGHLLTNVAGTGYGNANVAAFLPTYGGNVAATTVFGNNVAIQGSDWAQLQYNPDGVPHSQTDIGTGSWFYLDSAGAAFESNTTGTVKTVFFGNDGQVSAEGNITGANINTGGQVSATGNITGANILTGGQVSAYGNIATSGWVTAHAGITTDFGGVNAFFGNITAQNGALSAHTGISTDFGNIQALNGNVSASGNVTGAYILGNGSQLTGITATAGGSNTQIQYNNANAFAGNGLMTFNQTTGNINLGNLVINTNNIQTNVALDMSQATGTIANGNSVPWRITIGNGYQGSFSPQYNYVSPYDAYPRILAGDYMVIQPGVRNTIQTNLQWANVSANLNNGTTRITTSRNVLTMGGGTNNSTFTTSQQTGAIALSGQLYIGAAGSTTANALSSVGNITINSGIVGVFSGAQVNAGSLANTIGGYVTQLAATDTGGTAGYGNAVNVYGYYEYMNSNLSNTANISGTNLYIGYYHPGTTSVYPNAGLMGSIARGAGNTAAQPQYWAFRNDDNLARSRLGCLDRFHNYMYGNLAVSGNMVVNKNNGQSQQWVLTGNVTITGFSNFVTNTASPTSAVGNVYSTDTVTVLLNQGTTGGYTVTLPSTANVKYAGNVRTLSTTVANSVSQITVTAYPQGANAILPQEYLITVTSGFV
jgi:predicted acyltransferase (DUF342 family)